MESSALALASARSSSAALRQCLGLVDVETKTWPTSARSRASARPRSERSRPKAATSSARAASRMTLGEYADTGLAQRYELRPRTIGHFTGGIFSRHLRPGPGSPDPRRGRGSSGRPGQAV